MGKLTVVIEYKEGQPEPGFSAGMQVLGGEVVAVQFNDALLENELLHEYCRPVDISAAEYDDRWPTPSAQVNRPQKAANGGKDD